MATSDTSLALVADGDGEAYAVIAALLGRLGLSAEANSTGAAVLSVAAQRRPALVVLSVELSQPTGYEVCRELRKQFGEGLPIVFVAEPGARPHDEIAGLMLGADDYFVKPLRGDVFVARIRRLVARASPEPEPSSLTRREREVLGLLADGYRSAEVSERLCITRKTVLTHIEHILAKLGAHSQAQAVAIALRDGLVVDWRAEADDGHVRTDGAG